MADLGTQDRVDPAVARRTWQIAEPLHGMIYFAPERELYKSIGLRGQRMGYFASRSAALGTPSAETVVATFYNFSPAVIRRTIPDAWTFADPATILRTRFEIADRTLRRVLESDVDSAEMTEAAELAKKAAVAATDHVEGRPLFAAHASLDWPDQPHMVLFHAQTLLREFRGDGHIAALTVEGLSGIEALISHCGSGAYPPDVLRVSRAWTEDEWAAGVAGLADRGLVTEDGRFTEEGRKQREWLEERTDRLSLPAYQVLGTDGCNRLAELTRPWAAAFAEARLVPTKEQA